MERKNSNKLEETTEYALNMLDKAKNLDAAISLLLARVGESFDFDRVSVMEIDAESRSYRFTMQWAKHPADMQTDMEYTVSQDELTLAAQAYDKQGVATVGLSGAGTSLASGLYAGIWNHGVYAGALSFETDDLEAVWTPQHRKLIRELAKIIFLYVLKARADTQSQARNGFLLRMASDIRTSMTAISDLAAMGKAAFDDHTKAMDCLAQIDLTNQLMLELVNNVLDLSRIESGKMEILTECVDIADQIERLRLLMLPRAQAKNIRFTVRNRYTDNRGLQADAPRLNQVLMILIGNAIKFTGTGGSVDLDIDVARWKSTGVLLQFSVRDTGIGMSQESMRGIFSAFGQDGHVMGLGLSLSSRLVRLMSGTLEVTSQVGIGSDFRFAVSLCFAGEAQEVQVAAVQRTEEKRGFSGKTLLLAESSELSREIAVTILEVNGFSVETAQDGREALELFISHVPRHYDAILMDIRLPVLDGLDATKCIRTSGKKDSRSIPIIAMTDSAFNENMKKSMEGGMNGYLAKPIEIERLMNLLEECLLDSE